MSGLRNETSPESVRKNTEAVLSEASPPGHSKAWLEGESEGLTLCLVNLPSQPAVRVALEEVVGLDIHLNGDRSADEWTGALLVARRIPRLITYRSSVALILHVLLFLVLFVVTFDAVGPLTATILSGYFVWHAYQSQLPLLEDPLDDRPNSARGKREESCLPPVLFWWSDLAVFWLALVRLPGLTGRAWSLRLVALPSLLGLLCITHGSPPAGLPKKLLARCLHGSLFFIDYGLGQISTHDWWPQAARPIVVHFGPDELSSLVALRSSLLAAGHGELLQRVWVGNYHVETILSVVLPTTWYNSRTTRQVMHVIVNLGLPLFFCFQAFHILLTTLLSLNLPTRWQMDPIVRLLHLLDDGFHWIAQRPRFASSSGDPTLFGRAVGFVVGGVGRGCLAVLDWLAAVAMPVDYFLTYVQARLNSLRTALAPLLWALEPLWHFLQRRIFWGVPGFASLGWWRRAINAANRARSAAQQSKTPVSSPQPSPRKTETSEGSARNRTHRPEVNNADQD